MHKLPFSAPPHGTLKIVLAYNAWLFLIAVAVVQAVNRLVCIR